VNFNIVAVSESRTFPNDMGLSPTQELVVKSLSLCGHTVQISANQFLKDSVNLIFDHSFSKKYAEYIVDVKRSNDFKVGMYFGELYIDGYIPYAKHAWSVSDADETLVSQELMDRVDTVNYFASNLDFCWSALERNAHELKKFNPISLFFPHGHTQRLEPEYRRAVKDIDAIFIGKATEHRLQIVKSIEEAGVSVSAFGNGFPKGFLPTFLTGNSLNRSKIGLNLSYANEVHIPTRTDVRFSSVDRLLQFFERDICVVSEHIPFDNPYSEFMINGAPDELSSICRDLLESGDWKSKGAELAAKFRREFAAENIIPPVVDQTLRAIYPGGVPDRK
jgi:hypothetical protein